MKIDELKTPCFVIDEEKLISNLEILKEVEDSTGCKILLAQKAFSCYHEYPLIGKYISGTTASGVFEARLGREEMNKENHVYAPAFTESDMKELVKLCDHISFNSFSQLKKYRMNCEAAGVSYGIRVNPECSTQEGHTIYDPCAAGSRLGVTLDNFDEKEFEGVQGIHFHTLCEQNSDDLKTTLNAVEEKFGKYLKQVKWVNFGGGHHITREDYDIDTLKKCISHVKDTYNVEVYLEPGEAVALNAGYLITTVLDKVENGISTLILDTSASCHMPDVLEMPYRPPLAGSAGSGEKAFSYRLSSYTCLAGDIIGDYSFDKEIRIGHRLAFEDMAIYSMVKNNTFNGIPLPSIAVKRADGECEILREFGYEDFKCRL